MKIIEKYFKNSFYFKNNVHIINENDEYVDNFGKQWKTYRDIQIDSKNNFNISLQFLESIIFNKISYFKEKTVLEVGCGSGRFTENIIKYSKLCVAVDLSSAIFNNVSKNNEKIILIKSDILELISHENKFDVVICRGMLQHTPNPYNTLLKLYEFVKKDGRVFFDIYPMPKLGMLHPKYLIWRPLIKNLIEYENFEIFLNKNINLILKIKRIVKKIFFNNNFISDSIISIWDYKGKLKLNNNQLNQWAILDTLDGLYAKYDKPISHKKICNFLYQNEIEIIKKRKDLNCFETKISKTQ